MNNKILNTIKKYDMLSYGDNVVCAVSGGADSMALICFLLSIKEEFNLSLTVCHVNHKLRGEEAERDAKFVYNFCKNKGITFKLLNVDVSALSREKSMGFEECGREVRYNFFNETIKELGGGKIATAHSLSDCAETLVFNIARGTSPAGISSIAPVRDNVIRPLIECTREEIEAYLLSLGQSYVTDSTNSDTAYTRNFIRKEIIPNLSKLNPAFYSAVLGLTSLAREQSDFLNLHCESIYKEISQNKKIALDKFQKLHITEKRGIISIIFRENNIEFSKKKCDDILSMIDEGDFKISICKDGFLVSKNSLLYFENKKEPKEDFSFPVALGRLLLPDYREIKLSIISREEFENIKKNSPNLLKNCLSYDIINENFSIRNRKEGDFISLFPRNVTKTLKKLLIESKIECEKRDIIPLIANSSHIYWAEGLGVDAEAAVNDRTRRILFIEI